MHAMLQQDRPEDFVVSTGLLHTVKDFLVEAFSVVGLKHEPYTHTNPDHFRPAETVTLRGDSSKAQQLLNWNPTMSFKQLVNEMVTADIARLKDAQQ
jgi:GDPmannose 4,6-dehydratase